MSTTKAVSHAVSEIDLNAYVDGQLDPARRLEVEEYLSHHAADAMRVMADLRIRDALQWTQGGIHQIEYESAHTVELARRLDQALTRARLLTRFQRLAACVVLIALGWAGHVAFSTWSKQATGTVSAAPSFVDDAMRAHRSAALRSSLSPRQGIFTFDPVAVYLQTGIALPDFPTDWVVKDMRVLPATQGYGVEVVLDAGPSGRVSLFATHAVDPGVSHKPVALSDGEAAVVYWQHDTWAYALTGELSTVELDHLAKGLVMRSPAS